MSDFLKKLDAAGVRHILYSRLDETRTPGDWGHKVRYCHPACGGIDYEGRYWKYIGDKHSTCLTIGSQGPSLVEKLYWNVGISDDDESFMEHVARVGGKAIYHWKGMYLIGTAFNMRLPAERRSDRYGSDEITYGRTVYGFGIKADRADIIEEARGNPQLVVDLFYEVFPQLDFTNRGLRLDTKRTYWGPPEGEPVVQSSWPEPKQTRRKGFIRWLRS